MFVPKRPLWVEDFPHRWADSGIGSKSPTVAYSEEPEMTHLLGPKGERLRSFSSKRPVGYRVREKDS
jgi:hypothetical protein